MCISKSYLMWVTVISFAHLPTNIRSWNAGYTSSEFGCHALHHFIVSDFLQEHGRFSFLNLVTKEARNTMLSKTNHLNKTTTKKMILKPQLQHNYYIFDPQIQ